MKIPGEKGSEEGVIIAQSQFDVNQENIEGAVLAGLDTENWMVCSRRVSSFAPSE
jgi:hypothetical protein